jgi:serine/threonine protein kinase
MGIQYDFVKVLDFGLVKTVLGADESRMTRDGVTTGTPAYMAPEVALGNETIDGRADLYGLGCVAYWLLTGNLVFAQKSAMAMVMAHVQESPVPPSQKTELAIPASLDRVVMACLAKKPENRPATPEALARMLDECRDAGPWTQADAERWWLTNRPELVVNPDVTQAGATMSALSTQ